MPECIDAIESYCAAGDVESDDRRLNALPRRLQILTSRTISTTSAGSTRSSGMRTSLPYSWASARRPTGLVPRSRIRLPLPVLDVEQPDLGPSFTEPDGCALAFVEDVSDLMKDEICEGIVLGKIVR